MASFIAAGASYANHGINLIPFFSFYSMFGFQRIGDLIWAAADSRCKGFLMGGIAGRTTLAGEGLQHQDGHSQLLASVVPNIVAYDPAYAYELAVIIHDGLRRMFVEQEPVFYYITMYNETYPQPPMPEGAVDGILKGMYRLGKPPDKTDRSKTRPQLLGSGPILREVLRAQEILFEKFGVTTDVWSVPSYRQLRRDALAIERWNLLHPDHKPRTSYLQQCLAASDAPVIAASDYLKTVPELIAPWLGGRMVALGTDGFGRSDTRPALRRHFEVDAEHIAFTTLSVLARQGKFELKRMRPAVKELGIDPEKPDPVTA